MFFHWFLRADWQRFNYSLHIKVSSITVTGRNVDRQHKYFRCMQTNLFLFFFYEYINCTVMKMREAKIYLFSVKQTKDLFLCFVFLPQEAYAVVWNIKMIQHVYSNNNLLLLLLNQRHMLQQYILLFAFTVQNITACHLHFNDLFITERAVA